MFYQRILTLSMVLLCFMYQCGASLTQESIIIYQCLYPSINVLNWERCACDVLHVDVVCCQWMWRRTMQLSAVQLLSVQATRRSGTTSWY